MYSVEINLRFYFKHFKTQRTFQGTVDSKIIRALEIIHTKNSYLMQFCGINIYEIMIFRLYTIYNKHVMIKIGNQTREIIVSIIVYCHNYIKNRL